MSKFSLGDRVITVKDTENTPEGFIGHVVQYEHVIGESYVYAVHGDTPKRLEYFRGDELALLGPESITKTDPVNSPKHYAVFDDIEAIEIIARSMTKEMFKGYCFGNLLKYRLRAGGKDELQQEIGKANKYKELYEKYKELCQ